MSTLRSSSHSLLVKSFALWRPEPEGRLEVPSAFCLNVLDLSLLTSSSETFIVIMKGAAENSEQNKLGEVPHSLDCSESGKVRVV